MRQSRCSLVRDDQEASSVDGGVRAQRFNQSRCVGPSKLLSRVRRLQRA
jgi:hypothetical protein